jgi:hypothetical protein
MTKAWLIIASLKWRYEMNDYEKVEFALDVLESAEVVAEFETHVWVKIDKADWDSLWSQDEEI